MSSSYDIAIIGAGSGGLSVAAGAAQLGLKTVLFEAREMGGDCLNFGCVPSKSLIAAADRAHAAAKSGEFGIEASPRVNFPRVMAHVQEVIASIAPHDSVERFERLGAEVVRARARLVGRKEIEADGRRFDARHIVLATGSRPFIPPLDGLSDIPFLTNETIWNLSEQPEHLVILGGGNIGVELGQAFRRLGSEVTIVERHSIMGNDDPEFVEHVRNALREDGVTIRESSEVARASMSEAGPVLHLKAGGTVSGSHLLVAVGRDANIDDLGLDAAGVEADRAIKVDDRLRTSNKSIFAIGDCREGPKFTHAAGYDGGIVVRNTVFRLPAKADWSAMPWCTYTDPELAQVGLTEAKAREAKPDVSTVGASFADNDRARAERRTAGKIKLVLSKGKLVGCTIVGPHAGELIHPWALAMAKGLSVRDITSYIAPYPTLGEVSKAAANGLYRDKLFSPLVRRAVGFLSKLP
ncbi:dihydrolipoamide dehydrogenase [Pacificimonas flava]|uniref:Dihydrolipoamide dehydrogenase n=2 Tax=Pacificimonas TaxID=1960290 RepID=A0A219B3W8_9SPHN|nr:MULTISPECIES: FAD-dependent oxidoreductase [Pacificimonas]MBZ6377424.1 FAD-dependent oxidoreductase [Pacificimonas aurantium]OWV32874.1 dihydrolipoamide dehydrogenase [Pacificimonas flava]